MFFLYKKGGRNDPRNYRGISLINTTMKVFTRVLEGRLTSWAEGCHVLPECQSGFRASRGCIDNIFTLHCLIYQQVEVRGKKLFACFVDFESAFDSVPHQNLWSKLGSLGISSRIIRLFSNLYDGATLQVEINGMLSDSVSISKGILQGDSASPLLFSLYICDIEKCFREEGFHGIPVSNMGDILLLCFADDIIIFGDSQVDLKNKLNFLETYCKKLELTVNVSKTKIIIFHKGRVKKDLRFFYGGKLVNVVNKYKYLGVEFSSSGRFSEFCKTLLQRVGGRNEAIIRILRKAKSDSWQSKIKLFYSVVAPAFLYGSEIWGMSSPDKIESAQVGFFKQILFLNKRSPNWAVRLECGLPRVSYLIFQRAFGWLLQLLKMTPTRYPKICFNGLCSLLTSQLSEEKLKLNWVHAIKEEILSLGVPDLWSGEGFSLSNLERFHNNIIDLYLTKVRRLDYQLAEASNSCPLYKMLNPNFEIADHLLFRMSIFKIRCITQLRLASRLGLYLCVRGSGVFISCNESCKICNLREDEDVIHILIKCPMYEEVRRRYISNYFTNIIRDQDKAMVLLSNFDQAKINNLYLFIHKILEIRQLICSIG